MITPNRELDVIRVEKAAPQKKLKKPAAVQLSQRETGCQEEVCRSRQSKETGCQEESRQGEENSSQRRKVYAINLITRSSNEAS